MSKLRVLKLENNNINLPSRPLRFFLELPEEEDDLSLLFQRINMFLFLKFHNL